MSIEVTYNGPSKFDVMLSLFEGIKVQFSSNDNSQRSFASCGLVILSLKFIDRKRERCEIVGTCLGEQVWISYNLTTRFWSFLY